MNEIDWLLDSDPAIRWQVMRDLTDAPADEVAAERARVTHEGWGAGAYFGTDVKVIVDRLLTEQMDDGGWNCEQERGSTRGSFETTINVLEGFLEYERATGGNADVAAARLRGQEYLLERGLLRRRSDGELAQPRWLYLTFPNGWHYDVLRILDYLRDAGAAADERTAEAIGILESKRGADGRWPLEHALHDELPVDLGDRVGEPSRWITLRAMRVLRWAEGAARSQASAAAAASA